MSMQLVVFDYPELDKELFTCNFARTVAYTSCSGLNQLCFNILLRLGLICMPYMGTFKVMLIRK